MGKEIVNKALDELDRVMKNSFILLDKMERAVDPALGKGQVNEQGQIVNPSRDVIFPQVSESKQQLDESFQNLQQLLDTIYSPPPNSTQTNVDLSQQKIVLSQLSEQIAETDHKLSLLKGTFRDLNANLGLYQKSQ